MQRCVNVLGVGMSPFSPTVLRPNPADQIVDTARQTLADAGLSAKEVGAVFVAAGLMDDGILGRVFERAGLGHVPLSRLPGAEEDSGSLLFRACQALEQGQVECVLVLGAQSTTLTLPALQVTLGRYGAAAREYMARYQIRRETFAMVAVKARQHAVLNPLAAFNQPISLDEVLQASPIAEPLTYPQIAWPTVGVAAVLLCSSEFARRHARNPRVRIIAQACVSPLQVCGVDQGLAFAAVGYDVNVAAARELYEQAGQGPQEVDVCELHDSSTLTELLLYEALGLCHEGSAEKFIEDGDNTYGGNLVINPSGGLLSRGHAPAVNGLAQCIELVLHLRDSAGARQVTGARVALQHQTSVDGTVLTTLYQRD